MSRTEVLSISKEDTIMTEIDDSCIGIIQEEKVKNIE